MRHKLTKRYLDSVSTVEGEVVWDTERNRRTRSSCEAVRGQEFPHSVPEREWLLPPLHHRAVRPLDD